MPADPRPTRSSRRDYLKLLGLSGVTLAAASAGTLAQTEPARQAGRKRVLRAAHITDIHVEPERAAGEGLTQMLRHLQAQTDRPQLVLNTGDCIYDSTSHPAKRVDKLWDLWQQITAAELTLPMRVCIGNHDVWGWNKDKSKTTGDEPHWGKARALAALGMDRSYYSFDQAGWHFVALDSIHPADPAAPAVNANTGKADPTAVYIGKLDDEQFAWLEKDLAAVDPKTPVLVMSHIPILSVTPVVHPDAVKEDGFTFGGGAMHVDACRLKDLFRKYPNVKLAISGHQHLLDRVDYDGVSYLCNGAVSGGWWKEKNLGECDAGYTLIDLFDDGTFGHQYVTFGWQYRPDAKA